MENAFFILMDTLVEILAWRYRENFKNSTWQSSFEALCKIFLTAL